MPGSSSSLTSVRMSRNFEEYGGDADLVWVFGGKRIKAEVLRLFAALRRRHTLG